MGFRPGIQVTLDNALKMLMVKSPNDVAVTVAEGVSGSVEAFAVEMNAAAARLGMRESHFVNPNGLPDARQMSSARDMAMVARALIKEFPEENDIFGIGALQLGGQIIPTHNGLIGHYPGADGMKTGFTCAAGFNVVASATHGGRRLIAVVLGSPSARERTAEAAALFDRGFSQWSGGLGAIENLPSPGVGAAPDMHQEICSRRGRAAMVAGEEEDLAAPIAPSAGGKGGAGSGLHVCDGRHRRGARDAFGLVTNGPVHFDPIPVFIGPKPGWTGPVAAARAARRSTVQKAAASRRRRLRTRSHRLCAGRQAAGARQGRNAAARRGDDGAYGAARRCENASCGQVCRSAGREKDSHEGRRSGQGEGQRAIRRGARQNGREELRPAGQAPAVDAAAK